jgi:Amt family ammonium transporter
MTHIRWSIIPALIAVLILVGISLAWLGNVDPGESLDSLLALVLTLLFPTGLALVAWSALSSDREDDLGALVPLGLALALVGYLALGFGFQFGGAAFVSKEPELQNLSRYFSLVRGAESAGWGFVGLEGFFLRGKAATPAAIHLLLSQLPLVIAATLIMLLALPRKTPPMARALAGLIVSTFTLPIAGHWVTGGGWLASLGHTLNMGHGLVDLVGAGTAFLVAGSSSLAAALVFGRRTTPAPAPSETIPMPPARSPLLAGMGVLLALVGWMALGLANPLYQPSQTSLNWPLISLNGIASVAGGALLAQLYSWFTTGQFNPLMGPRGALAGLVAISAGAPFVSPWAALVTGGLAGLLLPLAIYAVDRLLHLEDTTAALVVYGLSGFWGLLAVGVFADGRSGHGWNGVTGPAGQGVSGLLVAGGLQPDSGQLAAQLWSAIALLTWSFLLPWGLLKLIKSLRNPQSSRHLRSDVQALDGPGESQSSVGSLDRVINVDDSG